MQWEKKTTIIGAKEMDRDIDAPVSILEINSVSGAKIPPSLIIISGLKKRVSRDAYRARNYFFHDKSIIVRDFLRDALIDKIQPKIRNRKRNNRIIYRRGEYKNSCRVNAIRRSKLHGKHPSFSHGVYEWLFLMQQRSTVGMNSKYWQKEFYHASYVAPFIVQHEYAAWHHRLQTR